MKKQVKKTTRVAITVTIEKSRTDSSLISDMKNRIERVKELIPFDPTYTLSYETEGTVGVEFMAHIPGKRAEIEDFLDVMIEQIDHLMFAVHEFNEFVDDKLSQVKPTITRLRN